MPPTSSRLSGTSRLIPIILLCLLAVSSVGAAAQGQSEAAIVGIYPNPVTDGDRGEFVTVRIPVAGNWTLDDGESIVRLPDNVTGVVAVSTTPGPVKNLTDAAVVGVSGELSLANGGERIRLSHAGRVVAQTRYDDAPSGQIFRPASRTWQPMGATDRPVIRTTGGRARAFVLPDAPAVAVNTLRGADRRVLLAGYTLSSGRVAEALLAAHRRNVTVRVLVEGKPVDGMTRRQARILDRLAAAGIDVRVIGGPAPRYEFHHPKYAVVDDTAVVLTENWKPAGIGGASSRGWGVVLADAEAARALATTFRADAGARDARSWQRVRRGRTYEEIPAATGEFDGQFQPRSIPVSRTRILVAPDNAEGALVGLLAGADESISVIQPSVEGPGHPLVRAARRAARRGVRVRILLSSAWYVREDNRRLAEYLTERAAATDVPLSVRLAVPKGRFEKIHAKGIIVDGDTVALGSLNWNNNSVRDNREVVVVMSGEAVAGYYLRVFDADWRNPQASRRLPVGLAGALVTAGVGALALARRIEFA